MAPPKKPLPNQPPPPEDVEDSSSEGEEEEEDQEESSEEESDGEEDEEDKEKPNSPQNQTFQAKKKADIVEKQVSSPPPSLPQSPNQAFRVNKKLKFGEKQTDALLLPAPNNDGESDDGSEEEDFEEPLASPSASDFTIKVMSPKQPTLKNTKPPSKRPSETSLSDEKTHKTKKKAKVSEEDSKKEKPSGGLVGRVCSEEDEVRILQGLIDYQVQKGTDPSADMGAFYLFVKGKLKAEITKTQLYEKVRRLKKKYFKNAEWVGKGEDLVFSKPHEGESFDLSKRIWGDGLIGSGGNEIVIVNGKSDGQKVKKDSKVESLDAFAKQHEKIEKKNSTEKKEQIEGKDLLNSTKKKEQIEGKDLLNSTIKKEQIEGKDLLKVVEVKDVEDGGDFGKKYPFTVQAYNSMAGLMTAAQVSFMKGNLSVVGSETSKEFEEKWKELQVKETELLLKKFQLFADHTRRVLDAMKK